MNKLYLTENGPVFNYTPVGNDKFVERWKNLIYNYVGEKSFDSTYAVPYPHFSISKRKFWKSLKLALKTEIRVKHKDLTKEERLGKLNKILHFYLVRVIVKANVNETAVNIEGVKQWL